MKVQAISLGRDTQTSVVVKLHPDTCPEAVVASMGWSGAPPSTAPVAVLTDDINVLQRYRRRQPTLPRILFGDFPDAKEALLAHHILGPLSGRADVGLVLAKVQGDLFLSGELSDVESLPMMPTSLVRILAVLDDPDVTAANATQAVESNVALTAGILKMANSSMWGRPRRVDSVHRAVLLLGVSVVRDTALAVGCFNAVPGATAADLEEVRTRGSVMVQLVRRMAGSHAAAAATAALLIGVGQLIRSAKPEYAAIREEAGTDPARLSTLELQHFGVTHAVLGARLLDRWNLPDEVVSAIALSNTAFPHPAQGLDCRALLYLAAALDVQALGGPPVDPVWISAMGIEDKVGEWLALVQDLRMCAT